MTERPATAQDLAAGFLPFLGLGFGAGLSPVAPGTVGTLVAIPLYLFAALSGTAAFMVTLILVCASGAWICAATAKQLGTHDHGAIVWDEIAGYFVTMALVPLSLPNVVLGFVLFRLFDILKPWPIRWCDRHVHGGVGIMLDDIIAGIAAAVCLSLINQWNPVGLF